jgi:SagB-type dehydrogenase family enzyme
MSLIKLPRAETSLGHPLELLLARRRTVREFAPRPVSLAQASCLLWAAQGITDARGLRTAPSAGALYPLSVYLVAGAVSGLEAGIYRYLPRENALESLQKGDRRGALVDAAMGQSWLADAALSLVFAARYARTTGKYGERGIQFVHIEAGHAAQSVLLTAVALNLAAAEVGAFDDRRVASLLGLSREETALYLLPVGQAAANASR